MTIIVGIICKDGIVLAADSQETYRRGVAVKRLGFEKIRTVIERGPAKVVMVGSGEGPFISRAAELLEAKLQSSLLPSPRIIADLAEDTLTEINSRYVVDRAVKLKLDHSEVNEPDLALMLGIFWKDAAKTDMNIFTIFPDGVAEKEAGYASLGSGSAYAEYLLARMYRDTITVEQGCKIAAYAVEQVKEVEPNCGGPTFITVIQGDGIHKLTREQINQIVIQMNASDVMLRVIWRVLYGDAEAVKELQALAAKAQATIALQAKPAAASAQNPAALKVVSKTPEKDVPEAGS